MNNEEKNILDFWGAAKFNFGNYNFPFISLIKYYKGRKHYWIGYSYITKYCFSSVFVNCLIYHLHQEINIPFFKIKNFKIHGRLP